MNAEKENAVRALQARVNRQTIQPQYNRYLQSARQNYDEATLKQMSAPYRADELKGAWTDKVREMTIYNLPINKLKKHQLYHELLNVNYDFSTLEKKAPAPAPRRRGRPARVVVDAPAPAQLPRRRGRPARVV
jgi:hypothetical protein